MKDEFECAVTGVLSGEVPEELEEEGPPPGWMQVVFLRKKINPKWLLIQNVKRGMLADLLQSYPPEQHGIQSQVLGIQIEATFHDLEQDTPVLITEIEDGVVVSDKPEAIEVLNEIRALLSLPEVKIDVAKEAPKAPPKPKVETRPEAPKIEPPKAEPPKAEKKD